MTPEQRQKLFNYFAQQYDLRLFDEDINEIEDIVLGEAEYLRRANENDICTCLGGAKGRQVSEDFETRICTECGKPETRPDTDIERIYEEYIGNGQMGIDFEKRHILEAMRAYAELEKQPSIKLPTEEDREMEAFKAGYIYLSEVVSPELEYDGAAQITVVNGYKKWKNQLKTE